MTRFLIITTLALGIGLVGLGGCTWVKPTEAGKGVTLVPVANVTHCERLGATKSSVKHKIGSMDRNEEKVTEELVTLARNEAAEMGGDSIVAQGPAEDGEMRFDVYRCSR
jgi:hypothetical protein